MNTIALVLLLPWLAGFAAFVGGALAWAAHKKRLLRRESTLRGIVAFGGGILVAAIAFALLPEATKHLAPLWLGVVFVAGGVSFCILDVRVSASEGMGAQFMAMLMDFVPEAISLGALFGHDHRLGYLIAGFIGLQNLPEGFNAFREIREHGGKARDTLLLLAGVSLLGPITALIGYAVLQDIEVVTASIMSFAAGGILYIVFQDIAVQSRLDGKPGPALGAVLGFAIGMVGNQLLTTV